MKAGEDLEYKLDMKKGQGVVYNISYGTLAHPGMMEVEFPAGAFPPALPVRFAARSG